MRVIGLTNVMLKAACRIVPFVLKNRILSSPREALNMRVIV